MGVEPPSFWEKPWQLVLIAGLAIVVLLPILVTIAVGAGWVDLG